MMPGKNGFEVLQKLRELDEEKRTPVLVITQYYLNDLEKEILKKQKIEGYLNKTASMERILFEVNNILYPDAENVRRKYRVAVNLPVTFRVNSDTFISVAFNLSAEGIFIIIQDQEPPKIGSTIKLKFWIPNSEQLLEIKGEVMWRNGFDDKLKKSHPPGIGVKFLGLDRGTRELLEDFLNTLRIAPEVPD